ncbi:hypothetical protein FACS1894181_16240 [Bacteroidia bacterium]|nr:hypothetical protein FACS1894181_16240 [Bacteroidia bacterium]
MNSRQIIRNGKRTGAFLLLALFVSYLAGTISFTHVHIIEGKVVTHSHPFQGTAEHPSHSHSTAQFQALLHLSHWLGWSGIILTFLVASFDQRGTVLFTGTCLRLCRSAFYYHALRAPPK